MDKMTEQMAIEVIKKLVPKTCKKVDGRLKGGFDDWESDDGRAIQAAIQALEEIQQYRAIGTVEELQALKEKSVAKSRNLIEGRYYCSRCGIRAEKGYCNECGQLNY